MMSYSTQSDKPFKNNIYMSSLFKKPSELEVSPTIKALVYGVPGIGKTSLALSAPSPVLLDFDGGVHRVNGAFQCPTLQVHSWDEVQQALQEDLSEFRTIVIDTVGKMLDYMSAYIIKTDPSKAMRDGSLSLKGYGVRKQMFINFIGQCSTMGKHLVFVAHEREDKDGETKVVRPEIGGSSAGDLIKELDLVGYMQAFGKNRTICWSPTEKFYAKNTCNLPEHIQVPTIIDANGVVTGQNTFLSQVFDSYTKYLSSQQAITREFESVMSRVTELVDFVNDRDTANEAMTAIAGMSHIWDSKTRAGMMLNKKCKALGLKYNTISKSYEPAA